MSWSKAWSAREIVAATNADAQAAHATAAAPHSRVLRCFDPIYRSIMNALCDSGATPPESVRDVDPKLRRTRTAQLGGGDDLPEIGARRSQCRGVELNLVEHINHFRPKLYFEPLPDTQILD